MCVRYKMLKEFGDSDEYWRQINRAQKILFAFRLPAMLSDI